MGPSVRRCSCRAIRIGKQPISPNGLGAGSRGYGALITRGKAFSRARRSFQGPQDDRVPQPANRARGSPRREEQTRGEKGKNQGPTRLQLSASGLFAAERRSAKKTPHGDQHRSSGNKARQPAPWCIDSAEMWWGFGVDSNVLGCACGCPAPFLPPTSICGTVVG